MAIGVGDVCTFWRLLLMGSEAMGNECALQKLLSVEKPVMLEAFLYALWKKEMGDQ